MNVLNVGTWYNIRKLIDKATANDETVTSGFIYNEINQLTNESDYHCQQVLENLIYKLSYDKPIIKRKALLVIKSCIERGNPNFRRDLHHKMEDLRKASNYTGVPDKLEGEAPYKRVREEANKVMNMMYDTRTTKKYTTDNIEGNKPSGLGQDTKVFHEYQDGSTGLNPSSNKIKLESYGNWKPTPQQKSTTEKVLEVGGQLVGGVTNLSSVAYNKVKTVITGKEESKPYEPTFEKSYYVPPSSNNVDFSGTGNIRKLAEGSKWEEHKTRRKKGEVSDSWNVDSSNDSYYDDHNSSSSSPKSTPKNSNNNKPKFDYSFQSNFDFINDNQYNGSSSSPNFSGDNTTSFNPNSSNPSSSNKQDDDQVDEAVEQYCFKLVEEITTPSGLRNHLEPSAINTFLKKAESLNIEVISFCLDAKLEDQNQKTILNALTLIESLLNSSNSAYKYFLDNTRNVEIHTESANQTVKSKATTVLNLILLKQKAKKKKTKKKKSTKNNTTTTNSTNSTSPSPQTNNNNNSLFNFLNETNVTNNNTPTNSNTNNNNLNNKNVNNNQQNVSLNQQGNLLGFLETNTTSNLNNTNNTTNNNTNSNNSNNNNTNNNNSNNNQFSILDDIKNLDISSNRAPPLNNLLNNYSPNPYPVHPHVQPPVYYNYPYQPPVVSYPSQSHSTLYSSPVTPQPTVSVNDSKNDSAFSFINDEIKKEVK